ncbi:MAG: helix-turn-helix domain-containing protein [Rhodospirillaceae bacterium]
MKPKKYTAKQQIFAQGDPTTNVYEVVMGCVKLLRCLSDGRRQIVGFFFSGDVIGLTAGKHYTYSAETITPTEIRCHRKNDLLRRLLQDDTLGENIVRLASDELASAHDQLTLLGCKRPMEKVASFILSMWHKSASHNPNNSEVYLPMTQTDMACFLNLAVETVSRCLCKFKRQGLVSDSSRHFLQIHQPDAIKAYAEGDVEFDAWDDANMKHSVQPKIAA